MKKLELELWLNPKGALEEAKRVADNLKKTLGDITPPGGVGAEAIARQFRAIEDRLDPVGAKTRKFKEDLAVLTGTFQSTGMGASRYAELTAKLKTEFEKAVPPVETMGNKIGKWAANMAVAYVSIETLKKGLELLVDVTKEAIAEGMKAEVTEARLENVMRKRGVATEENIRLLNEYAIANERATTFTKDATLEAATAMLEMRVPIQEIPRLVSLSADIAVKKNIEMAESASLVARAYQGYGRGLAMLVGLFGGAAKSGEELLSVVQRMFGGLAEAQAATMAGRIQQVKNAWSLLLEEVGTALVKNESMKAGLVELTTALIDTAEWVSKNREALGALEGVARITAIAIGGVLQMATGAAGIFAEMNHVASLLAPTFALLSGACGLLGSALSLDREGAITFMKEIGMAWGELSDKLKTGPDLGLAAHFAMASDAAYKAGLAFEKTGEKGKEGMTAAEAAMQGARQELGALMAQMDPAQAKMELVNKAVMLLAESGYEKGSKEYSEALRTMAKYLGATGDEAKKAAQENLAFAQTMGAAGAKVEEAQKKLEALQKARGLFTSGEYQIKVEVLTGELDKAKANLQAFKEMDPVVFHAIFEPKMDKRIEDLSDQMGIGEAPVIHIRPKIDYKVPEMLPKGSVEFDLASNEIEKFLTWRQGAFTDAYTVLRQIQAEHDAVTLGEIEASDEQILAADRALFFARTDAMRQDLEQIGQIMNQGGFEISAAFATMTDSIMAALQNVKAGAQSTFQGVAQVAGAVFGFAAQVYGTLAAGMEVHNKSDFENQKKLRITQVRMNTAAAIMNIWATSGNPYIAAAFTALVAAEGLRQENVIKAQKYESSGTKGFAAGTRRVPKTGYALLHEGEAVVPAREAEKIRLTTPSNILTFPAPAGPVIPKEVHTERWTERDSRVLSMSTERGLSVEKEKWAERNSETVRSEKASKTFETLRSDRVSKVSEFLRSEKVSKALQNMKASKTSDIPRSEKIAAITRIAPPVGAINRAPHITGPAFVAPKASHEALGFPKMAPTPNSPRPFSVPPQAREERGEAPMGQVLSIINRPDQSRTETTQLTQHFDFSNSWFDDPDTRRRIAEMVEDSVERGYVQRRVG